MRCWLLITIVSWTRHGGSAGTAGIFRARTRLGDRHPRVADGNLHQYGLTAPWEVWLLETRRLAPLDQTLREVPRGLRTVGEIRASSSQRIGLHHGYRGRRRPHELRAIGTQTPKTTASSRNATKVTSYTSATLSTNGRASTSGPRSRARLSTPSSRHSTVSPNTVTMAPFVIKWFGIVSLLACWTPI